MTWINNMSFLSGHSTWCSHKHLIMRLSFVCKCEDNARSLNRKRVCQDSLVSLVFLRDPWRILHFHLSLFPFYQPYKYIFGIYCRLSPSTLCRSHIARSLASSNKDCRAISPRPWCHGGRFIALATQPLYTRTYIRTRVYTHAPWTVYMR